MTPDATLKALRKGEVLPLYLVVGEERFLRDKLVAEVRAACLGGGLADFNEDKFIAGEADIEKVLAAARTVPMMAPRRFVLVRSGERWDGSTGDGDDERPATAPLDRLAAYAQEPVSTTTIVFVASKLDGRRKLMTLARKQGFLVSCEPLGGRELVSWIVQRAKEKGHDLEEDVAQFLAELSGPDLATLDDALERLSLYVGPGATIDEHAIGECVARVRTADTWALVDAVGRRDLAAALRMLVDVYDPRDRGLPLLGALAWSLRQLAKYQIAVNGGASPDEAARRAGVFQPFRARELGAKVRAFRSRELERCLLVLAETDLALKGSRRSADAILEDMLTRLCRRAPA